MASKLSSNHGFKAIVGVVLVVLLVLTAGDQKLWSQANGQKTILAQRLVDQVAAKHRAEVTYVGLHSIPPNGMNMAVIATTDLSTIGRLSDAQELSVLGGHTLLDMKEGSIVILQKLRDRSGQTVGVAVISLKLADGQETAAAKLSETIDKELAQEIPFKAALFEKTP